MNTSHFVVCRVCPDCGGLVREGAGAHPVCSDCGAVLPMTAIARGAREVGGDDGDPVPLDRLFRTAR